MSRHRRIVFLFGVLALLNIIPESTFAQADREITRAMGGIESHEYINLDVQVQGPGGIRLDTLAIVSLLDASGKKITSKLAIGSDTMFASVFKGSYIVSVEAPGYASARVTTPVSVGTQYVVVRLQKEGIEDTGVAGPTARVALVPKAQKEFGKGLEALQANQFDESIKHLLIAQRLAPDHPDVAYTLGKVYEKKQDFPSARKYWDQSLTLDPRHLSSLLSLGAMLIHQQDENGARKYLDKAVEIAPNSWRAQGLLAEVLLRQEVYSESVTHAERAIELGKEQANSSLLILGQALANQHQNEEAIKTLQSFLATKPPEATAQAVQNLINHLSHPDEAAAGGGGPTPTIVSAPSTVAADPLTPETLHWLPQNVDDNVPPVEPGVACQLDDVLQKVSERVQELPRLIDRYSATEVLHHEEENSAGYTVSQENVSFNYVASIQELKSEYGNFINVDEYRNGSAGSQMFPDQMATKGLPSMALIFHPWVISDFETKCEGLGRLGDSLVWQVYFRQRADKDSRIRAYRIGDRRYTIALKGRAWIDAKTFQVLKMETDLREPYPDIKLSAEHLEVEYGPVQFKTRKETLWLPASAEFYSVFRGHRIHRHHGFQDYTLFSIDDQQKIGSPPSVKTADTKPQA